jgi:hypothetical protein
MRTKETALGRQPRPMAATPDSCRRSCKTRPGTFGERKAESACIRAGVNLGRSRSATMQQTGDESGQQHALPLQDFRGGHGEGVGMWIAAGRPSGPSRPRDAGREHGWMRHRNVYNVSPLKCGPSRGLGGQPSFGCVRSSPHWPPQQTVVVSRGWALNPGRCRTVNEASHVGDSVKGARPS